MEQEQILDRGARVTLETGKQLFQFLAYAAQQLYKRVEEPGREKRGRKSWLIRIYARVSENGQ